jgi:4-cresol dehydrogenase (hydroxylating)
VSRDGVGPWLDGLFTQSRLGIVTRLTMWLYPRPKHFQTFLGWISNEAQLGRAIDAARTLRLEGTVDSTLAAFNDFRTLTFTHRYPWDETAGATPLPEPLRLKLLRKSKAARWMILGTLDAPSWAQARADRRRVRRVLRGNVDKLVFIDGLVARIGRWIRRPYQWLTGIDLAVMMDSLYYRSACLGYPTDEGIASTYWRKKTPTPEPPQDPDRDRCGIVFLGEVVPCEGRHVQRVVRMIEETAPAHGFEPVINLSAITERTIHVIAALLYDRDTPGEDERAAACHDELAEKLAAEGYLPYRLGIHSMQSLPPSADDYNRLMQTLREALDPNNILAPGRYEFGDEPLRHEGHEEKIRQDNRIKKEKD